MKNDVCEYCKPFVGKTNISDHYTTILNISYINQRPTIQCNTKTNIKYVDYKKLRKTLKEYNWTNFYNTLNDGINMATETFVNLLKNMTDAQILSNGK